MQRFSILRIHLQIDAGSRAIVFAHRVNGRRIAHIALVFFERCRVEEAQTLFGFGELLGDEEIRIGAHQMFGKMIGIPYAEGFITEKVIGIRDFDAFVQMDT